jgi:hypothetical protein
MSVRVNLSPAIYPQVSVERAIHDYRDFCSVKVLTMDLDRSIAIEITAPVGNDENQVVHEFLNYLLDLSLEKHLQLC